MKSVSFKYTEPDGSIELGVPENVMVLKGNNRDGGCHLKFETSLFSIGICERFSLYLFAEDVNRVTKEIWKGYVETEPNRARENIDRMISFLKGLRDDTK